MVMRWASAGEKVIIGSRLREKAERVASEIEKQTGARVKGTTNLEAASKAKVVVLSIPFEAVTEIIGQIKPALTQEKIIVSTIAPIMRKGKLFTHETPRTGSAAEEVAKLVPRGVPVISAFQTVGAKQLQNFKEPLNCDILICGDSPKAKRNIVKLIEKIPGARAVDLGPLKNSRLVEPLAALLAELTRRHHAPGIGLRFEGIQRKIK